MTEPTPEPQRTLTQRWLSAAAFSFVIIAAYLIWRAFHVTQGSWHQYLYVIGGGASASLAMLGMRERHRRQ